MRVVRSLALICALILVLLLAACDQGDVTPTALVLPQPPTPANGEVIVLADSSLRGAFGEIGKQAEATDVPVVTFNFADSQALLGQLSKGATADVFATSDEKTMIDAVNAGLILTGTYRTFVSDRLEVITAPGSKSKVSSLQDLAAPGIKLLLAADTLPAGIGSLQVLDKLSADATYGAGFKDKVLANVVSREADITKVVSKVQAGEADAGIVYRTDATSTNAGTIEIPDPYNAVAEYYITALQSGPNISGARTFIGHLFTPSGQQAIQTFGFSPPLPK
jgi:molybdate transport system substrate-binding protein